MNNAKIKVWFAGQLLPEVSVDIDPGNIEDTLDCIQRKLDSDTIILNTVGLIITIDAVCVDLYLPGQPPSFYNLKKGQERQKVA